MAKSGELKGDNSYNINRYHGNKPINRIMHDIYQGLSVIIIFIIILSGILLSGITLSGTVC